MQVQQKIIMVMGPTASGKSTLVERLIGMYGGCIVNADSRQMYRGVEIVSAQPQKSVHAKLYGCKDVAEPYSFVEYVRDADEVIADACARGEVPIVVGGTGLYLDALVRRDVPPPAVTPEIRARVANMTFEEHCEFLKKNDPRSAAVIDIKNPRRVSRALEVFLQTGTPIVSWWGKKSVSPYRVIKIGWTLPREELHARIAERVEEMWRAGAVHEVRALLDAGHTIHEPGMQAIGVSEIAAYVHGECSETLARERMCACTRQYARRQLTWFRRDRVITWYTSFETICHSLQKFLQDDFKD